MNLYVTLQNGFLHPSFLVLEVPSYHSSVWPPSYGSPPALNAEIIDTHQQPLLSATVYAVHLCPVYL